ncbi:MAG: 50S ribosomal protein L21 [bacterium]
MEAYAVVDTGGKQYLVKVGEQVSVELLAQGDAKQVTLDRVLALSDGKELKIGAPVIKGAKVTADVIRDYRSPKLVSFKKKRRKGYSRKIGHRQEQTMLKIVSIA